MSSAWPEQLGNDLRFAVRSLSRARAFSLTVFATLVVAIGVTTIVFELTSWIIFRDLPYPQPEQLYYLGYTDPLGQKNYFQAGFYLRDYREQTTSFSAFAACYHPPNNVVLDGQPLPDQISEVSDTFFSMTKLQPVQGRAFRPEEFASGHNDVVILTHRFWRKYFDQDPLALGRTVTIQGRACTIVGIFGPDQSMPQYFYGDVYRPFVLTLDPNQPFQPFINILGRLKGGVSPAQAAADLGHITLGTLPPWAKRYFVNNKPVLTPISDVDHKDTWWMMLAAGILLFVIGCLNAMNLMLIRLFDRRRELSIRFAVGGSRGQVLQLVALEGLLLSFAACAVVLVLTRWAFPPIFAVINGNDSGDYGTFLNLRTLLFISVLSVFSCLVASAGPVLRLLRADINSGLKDGGPTLGESRRTGQVRNAFVVFQAAFAVILLTGTGLLVRSFDRLGRVDLGFEPVGKVKVWVQQPVGRSAKPEETLAMFERLQRQLTRLPGVRGVSFGQDALLPGGFWGDDEARLPDGTFRTIQRSFVSPDYFQTAGFTLRSGRWFSERHGTKEVVLNETLAKTLFGNADPVGQLLTLKANPKEPLPIVGVVKDARETPTGDAGLTCYSAISLQPRRTSTLILRLDQDPSKEFSAQLRKAVFAVDDQLFMSGVEPISQLLVSSLWAEHYASRILKGLSVIALALTIVGIFSVLAYTVDSRKSEFGVRLALGETPEGLNRLVMRRGLGSASLGVALGLAGAAGLTRLMKGMLYQTSSYDGVVYGCVAAILLAAAAAACWIPARRAGRVDVIRLLKQE